MIKQQDAVSLLFILIKLKNICRPKSSNSYLQQILKELFIVKNFIKNKYCRCLNTVAEKIKRRGLVIIISDFFDDVDKTLKAMKHFAHKRMK